MSSGAISLADIKTYAQLNEISASKAKKIIDEEIKNPTGNIATQQIHKDTEINFISSRNFESLNEELSYYENFFTADGQESLIAQQIEEEAQNANLSGKSLKEIVKYFAQTLDIFENDASEIFTPIFLSEVLGIETQEETNEETNKETI